jgi:hypothetical protein
VFVVGSDVADALVQPGAVVEGPEAVEFGVLGRPECWAMRVPAMNTAVALEVIRGPLSEIASSREQVVVVRDDAVGELVEQVLVEQILLAIGDQRTGEGHLDLRSMAPHSSASLTIAARSRSSSARSGTSGPCGVPEVGHLC